MDGGRPSHVLTPENLDEELIAEYKEAFSLFDEDGDGLVDVHELDRVMRSLEKRLSKDELLALVTQFDVDEDGLIDFSEFLNMMVHQHNTSCSAEAFTEVFLKIYSLSHPDLCVESMTQNQKDEITVGTEEITQIMYNLGETRVTQADVVELMKEADIDGDGRWDMGDFIKLMKL